jgi:hypothetical protein
MLEKIREEVEKISLLAELGKELSSKNDEESRLRLDVAKEQILKSTYKLKKILIEMESAL